MHLCMEYGFLRRRRSIGKYVLDHFKGFVQKQRYLQLRVVGDFTFKNTLFGYSFIYLKALLILK